MRYALLEIKLRTILYGLFLVLTIPKVIAQPGTTTDIVLDGEIVEPIIITSQAGVFWDEKGKMVFEDIFGRKDRILWKKLYPEMPERLGPGKSWVRFSVHNATKDRIEGLVRCFRLRRVMHQWINAYVEHTDRIEIQRAGRFRSYQHRASPTYRDCLRLEIEPGETQTYWIQLIYAYRHEPDMGFSLTTESLMEEEIKEEVHEVLPTYLFSFFFLGVIAVLMIFAGIQYLDNRDKAFGWYFLYLFGLLVLSLRNIESQSHVDILYTYILDTYYILMVPITLFCYYACLMFMEHFLHFHKYDSYQEKVLKYTRLMMVSFVIVDIVLRITKGPGASMKAFDLYQIPLNVLVIYYLYRAFQIRNRLSYFIISGLFFMMAGAVIMGVMMNVWDGYFVSNESIWLSATTYMRLGVLLGILSFMLGLSYKTRLSLEEKHSISQRLSEVQHKQKLEAEKNRLYTNITHEFRTPLTIITGMAEQIRDQPKKWLYEGTEMILRNSENLLTLVSQMLNLNKLESGQLTVQYIQGDIISYLSYLVESFHSYAEFRDIQLQFHSELEELYVDFDPEKIQHVVSNLLSNAIKFTPDGGKVTIRLTVIDRPKTIGHSGFSESTASNFVEVTVADNGQGIPQKDLPYIFDRFYQVEHSNSHHTQGTGIGLALTKELVELLNGHISVESSPEKGSIFSIYLPISHTAKQTLDWGSFPDPKPRTIPLQTLTNDESDDRPILLLVEDNVDVIRYLISCVADEYRVLTADNGKKGLNLAIGQIPDLIISDVMMPIMDGLELCRKIKSDTRTSHIPIILLTAKSDTNSRLEGISQGAEAYLAKPFNKAELLLRIRKLLELRSSLQLHYASLGSDAEKNPKIAIQPKEHAFVLRVRGIVESHISNSELDVETLCKEIGISHSQLHRKLIALIGCSTNIFIRRIRMTKAKELLSKTELTISEVAYEAGFNDPAYFTRQFRKSFDIPPTNWRKKYKEKDKGT